MNKNNMEGVTQKIATFLATGYGYGDGDGYGDGNGVKAPSVFAVYQADSSAQSDGVSLGVSAWTSEEPESLIAGGGLIRPAASVGDEGEVLCECGLPVAFFLGRVL